MPSEFLDKVKRKIKKYTDSARDSYKGVFSTFKSEGMGKATKKLVDDYSERSASLLRKG